MTKRVVLISGAGRGIGRAIAAAFGGQGDHIVLAARSAEELEHTAQQVRTAGGAASIVPCDVTAEPHVARLVETAAALGPLDVVVCNAGSAVVAPFERISLADWERSVRVTLTGTFLLAKHAVAHMPRGGTLFVLGSIAGRSGIPQWSAYSAAKFGVLGFAQAIREELRPRGIRVTSVIPGAVDTTLWDSVPGEWNRANMLRPDDVARAILQAAAEPEHMAVDELVIGHVAGKL